MLVSGAPKARASACELPKTDGSPRMFHWTPWFSVRKTRPVPELMRICWPESGLTAKLYPPTNGHCCGSGTGPLWVSRIRPLVRPTVAPLGRVTWKKLVPSPPQQGQL